MALRYTLSRFEVVGDSTELSELSSVQQLRPAQFNRLRRSIRGYEVRCVLIGIELRLCDGSS